MSDIVFEPWGVQNEILEDNSRTIFCAASKRSGKTEICAIKSVLYQEQKPNYKTNSVDQFIGVIIAPTHDMLRRLSLKKFLSYAKPFIKNYNKSTQEITWHDGSLVYGISAEKPQRLEGIKANWIWIDEVLQCHEQIYLESMARVSDQKGFILLSGSLGPQFINPKNHWCYKHFKENNNGEKVYEWTTLDNPHFPKEEHAKLKATLNPSVFRSMFEINWDTKPLASVFPEYDDNNLGEFQFRPELETYISIDWGYANDMAVLFIQYDRTQDYVYVLDEISQPRITVLNGQLWSMIISKAEQHGIKTVKAWVCDIAGLQEREQTGISNVMWFRDQKKINFLMRRTPVLYGLPIMRNYIQDGLGRKKLIVHKRCAKLHDQLKMYRYNTKNGEVLDENPVKKDDHGCFSGDTFVFTTDGNKKIKDVSPGDLVLTRRGFKQVLNNSVRMAETFLYQVDNKLIRCTSNHKFFDGDNFTPIKSFTNTVGHNNFVHLWKNQKPTIGMESNIADTLMVNANLIANIFKEEQKRVSLTCIEIFGHSIMEKFQLAITFIILTVIIPITILKILRSFLRLNIYQSTLKKNLKIQNLEKCKSGTWRKLDHSPKSGTPLRREESGILNTEKRLQKICPWLTLFVRFAQRFLKSKRTVKTELNSAQIIAGLPLEDAVVSTMNNGHAILAGYNLLPINTQKSLTAQENALSIPGSNKQELVYNLSVKDVHEYYANEILVANCDALRYYFLNVLDPAIKNRQSRTL